MRRLLSAAVKPAALLGTALAAGLLIPRAAEAVSATTMQLQLFADQPQASVNGQNFNLDEPPAMIDGQFYAPARWLADTLRLSLDWDGDTRTIRLVAPKAFIEFDAPNNKIKVNGSSIPFDSVAVIRNDKLLVQLAWLAPYANLPFRYQDETKSVVANFIRQPSGPYQESQLRGDDAQPNSKPAAIFAFGKSEYRLGEPVDIIDLSYDPDAEGLPDYEWTGKQEAYFKPGVYTVTLRVSDGHGNRSEPFSKSVKVRDELYVGEDEYPFYFKPAGTTARAKAAWLDSVKSVGADAVTVRQSTERPLIRGSSAQPVTEKGYLYQDTIAKQARLSLQYANGLDKPARIAVVLRNESTTKPVKVTTQQLAESQPSVYAPLRAQKTLETFLAGGSAADELSIEPGAAVFYKTSPVLAPGQAFQGLYDLASSGAVTVSYVLMEPEDKLYQLGSYRTIALKESGNGTYPVSEVGWQVDARTLTAPTAIGFGDSTVEATIAGTDALNKREAPAPGFAGVHYRLELETGRPTTVAIHPRSGYFQGAIRVDGNVVAGPSGGLTSNDILIIHRTSLAKKNAVIELMAADGSQIPVDLVLIPLRPAAE
ncbi:copper amine oxidase N-terminal domain-containing protein [Paenibacillus piri]|uniref:Copper amine oxidase N-terminal domain-containing protein n=1 Tax=Paenibacillus piri TaxID=2547395 RepID=A0A4R5KWY8_9BACL|nr:copper amine oxidase N-terminal domain-containing protein [Paenibacillus piri]TDF99698.1 copper amine oxidase N-terminal domain-containing protein [Paenibacillus piri]